MLGCSSTPELYLLDEPIEVTNQTVNDHWIQKNEKFSFRIPINRTPKKNESGYVIVRYLIDSNGNTFNPEIIESVPEGLWDFAGVKAITKQDFVPSKTNTSNTPVYYSQKILFE
jgi:outer membrane biosynthesis protein TonB